MQWGDGDSSPTAIDTFQGLSILTARHTYPAAGNYSATLTLISRATAEQTSQSLNLTVTDPPLEIPSVLGPSLWAATSEPSSPETLTPDPAGPPAVMAVYVDSAAWTSALRTYMRLGPEGYAIPAGTDQLKALPWTNVDTIRIAFSEDVSVQQSSLELRDANAANYAFSGFSYDSITFLATWTLASALPNNKLVMVLDGTPLDPAPVLDADGYALDGEWTDSTSTFPSGDGEERSDFLFRANALRGDANGDGLVNNDDVTIFHDNAGYSPRGPYEGDFNGDAHVDIQDLLILRANFGADLSALADPAPYDTPTITAAASATPSPVTGTTADLSVLATAPRGAGYLTYEWSVVSAPTGAPDATFEINGIDDARNDTVTFYAPGTYVLEATAYNGTATATSQVSLTVQQTFTVQLTPADAEVGSDGTVQFTAVLADQFGTEAGTQPSSFEWSVTPAGLGSIDSAGMFTAASSGTGNVTVTATSPGESYTGQSGTTTLGVNLPSPILNLYSKYWYEEYFFNGVSGSMSEDWANAEDGSVSITLNNLPPHVDLMAIFDYGINGFRSAAEMEGTVDFTLSADGNTISTWSVSRDGDYIPSAWQGLTSFFAHTASSVTWTLVATGLLAADGEEPAEALYVNRCGADEANFNVEPPPKVDAGLFKTAWGMVESTDPKFRADADSVIDSWFERGAIDDLIDDVADGKDGIDGPAEKRVEFNKIWNPIKVKLDGNKIHVSLRAKHARVVKAPNIYYVLEPGGAEDDIESWLDPDRGEGSQTDRGSIGPFKNPKGEDRSTILVRPKRMADGFQPLRITITVHQMTVVDGAAHETDTFKRTLVIHAKKA